MKGKFLPFGQDWKIEKWDLAFELLENSRVRGAFDIFFCRSFAWVEMEGQYWTEVV